MDRSELEKKIDELEKIINNTKRELDKTDSKDERDLLKEQIEKYTKELDKLKRNLDEIKKKKAPKGTGTESKEKGSFGEVVSCLFGQVDKRVNNLVFKSESFYNWAKEKRMNRYEQLGKYSLPRIIISAILMAAAIPLEGFGVIPTIGLVYGSFVGVRTIGDLIRKVINKPPVIVRKKEITKGSYFENIKNAWNKFIKPRHVTKPSGARAEAKPAEDKIDFDDKAENLINTFVKAVEELKLNDINSYKDAYNYCYTLYNTIKKNGLLDKIKPEVMIKYEKLGLVNLFVKSVDKLNTDKLDKESYDACHLIYKRMEEKFGDEFLKDIPSETVVRFDEYGKALKGDGSEEVKISTYARSLLVKLNNFELVTERKSVNECSRLLKEIDLTIPSDSPVRSVSKFQNLWKKYKKLKKDVVRKERVLLFVDKVNAVNSKINKGEIVGEGEILSLIELHEKFDKDVKYELALYDDINSKKTLEKFNDILVKYRVVVLEKQIMQIDIEECRNKENISEIMRVVNYADNMAKTRRKKNGDATISEAAQKKLDELRAIAKDIKKYNHYTIRVRLAVYEDGVVCALYNDYEGKIVERPMSTVYDGDMDKLCENAVEELSSVLPMISNDKIKIGEIIPREGNGKIDPDERREGAAIIK